MESKTHVISDSNVLGPLLTVCFKQAYERVIYHLSNNPCLLAGRPLTTVLQVLSNIDPPAFQQLAQKFRLYAACVGLVDTGYFRKRSENMETDLNADETDLSKLFLPQERPSVDIEGSKDESHEKFLTWFRRRHSTGLEDRLAPRMDTLDHKQVESFLPYDLNNDGSGARHHGIRFLIDYSMDFDRNPKTLAYHNTEVQTSDADDNSDLYDYLNSDLPSLFG